MLYECYIMLYMLYTDNTQWYYMYMLCMMRSGTRRAPRASRTRASSARPSDDDDDDNNDNTNNGTRTTITMLLLIMIMIVTHKLIVTLKNM